MHMTNIPIQISKRQCQFVAKEVEVVRSIEQDKPNVKYKKCTPIFLYFLNYQCRNNENESLRNIIKIYRVIEHNQQMKASCTDL